MDAMRRTSIRRAVELMPKVELHVHFEGSISSETIEKLARKNGIELGPSTSRSLPTRARYEHLISFLDSYRFRCKCLRKTEDFEAACVDVLRNLQAQGTRYAEIMTPPTVHRLNGLSMDDVMEGIKSGVKSICGNNEMEVRFIFDIGRQFGTDHAWQTVREAVRHQANGVIALGLGGDEIHFSPEIFVEQFAWARKEGLHLVAHAGEVTGPSSVWGAVKSLGAERIEHGIGARGDELLLEHLRIHDIPLDMCPTSNVETGAVRSYADHPLPEYLRRGLLVTLNTDDPAMFGTSLTQEYQLCHEKLGLDWGEIKTLCLNGVRASFLPDMDKQRLYENFEEALAKVESETGLSD